MKAYISSKITGDPNYREKFAKAKKYLEGKGYVVLNPAELPEGLEYEDYMHIAFAYIDVSDIVFMFEDWRYSNGALRERFYAQTTKTKIEYEEDGKL